MRLRIRRITTIRDISAQSPVAGDPLKDFAGLQNVSFVVKGGSVFRLP